MLISNNIYMHPLEETTNAKLKTFWNTLLGNTYFLNPVAMLNLHTALCTWFQAIFIINQIQLHSLFRYSKSVMQSHGPEMIPGKQRKRKTYFSYLVIDCCHHGKCRSVQMHSVCLPFTLHSVVCILKLEGQYHTIEVDWKQKGIYTQRCSPSLWAWSSSSSVTPTEFLPQHPGTKKCLRYQSCACKFR